MLNKILGNNPATVKDMVDANFVTFIADEWQARIEDGDERVMGEDEKAEMYRNLYSFVDTLQKTAPVHGDDNYVMVAVKFWQEGKFVTGSSLYRRRDLETLLKKAQEIEIPDMLPEEESAEYYEKIVDAWYGTKPEEMISSFGYEFSPWGEILSVPVISSNVKRVGHYPFLADVLWEMSFCGWTEKERAEGIAELDKAIDESKKYKDMPEEEKQNHLHSLDDLYDGFGWKTPAEEEIEQIRPKLLRDSAKSVVWFVRELREIAKEAENA